MRLGKRSCAKRLRRVDVPRPPPAARTRTAPPRVRKSRSTLAARTATTGEDLLVGDGEHAQLVSGAETKRIVSLGKSPRKILVVRSWPVWASTSRLPRNVKGESASTPCRAAGTDSGGAVVARAPSGAPRAGTRRGEPPPKHGGEVVDDSPLDNPVMHAASAVARGEMEGDVGSRAHSWCHRLV